MRTRAFLTVLILTGVLAATTGAAQGGLLFEIGARDNRAAELALGPDGYRGFEEDAFYLVGLSEAARDWPYAHPGPHDNWAGSRPHTFVIVFTLAEQPDAPCRLMLDLVDTHASGPPRLRIAVNGHAVLRKTPAGRGDPSLDGDAAQGKEHVLSVTVPPEDLDAGPNTIEITNEAGSWLVYDWVGFEAPPGTRLTQPAEKPYALLGQPGAPPLLAETAAGPKRVIRTRLRYYGPPAHAVLRMSPGQTRELELEPGEHLLESYAPDVQEPTEVRVALDIEGETLAERRVKVAPVRKWTLYLLHHTHLDIGYTHHQSDVERIQWQHMDKAIALAKATAEYPEPSRFVWLPEGLWAVDSYLDQATEAQREAFFAAVKRGDIGLDALYGNELTALCRPEELIELTGYARRLARKQNLTIDSAMITDVPGYTWGIIPVLAKSGVKYFSVGPNRTHRIGFTLTQWGDKPFYWVSPSGREKVLTWVHGEGYSWFHGGVSAAPEHHAQYEEKILGYLARLEERPDYPFDMAILRYNIGGDNGPPDEYLPAFIRQWNEKYAYPKLSFATTSGAFRAFEAKYGEQLPEIRGDFTPYWEDGAASSARETALNRAAVERLVQAGALGVLTGVPYDAAAYQEAWRQAILYDEHTWGAHNSITQPHSEFALQQWATKQEFALTADRMSRKLLETALAPIAKNSGAVEHLGVANTSSWPRTGLVVLPADWELAGDKLSLNGKPVPTQRLNDGALAFVARDVPALSAAMLRLEPGGSRAEGKARAEGAILDNGLVRVRVDEQTGAIVELRLNGGPNLAGDAFGGLNAYRYVAGRVPDNPQPNGPVQVEVVDAGPVVATLRITSDAPGCEKLVREMRVVDGLPHVYLADLLDKTAVYEQEGVHIAFPFNVPDGVIRMDTPFTVVRPEADQLEGACKNYFTVQRWVDVSNERRGVTWATLDAPLVEVGGITNDPRATEWITELEPSTTILSYVMNNYWETNYKAAQEGPTTFRYVLRPHTGYDQAAAHRFGIAQSQPLVPVPLKQAYSAGDGLVAKQEGLMVMSMALLDANGQFRVRLFNTGEKPADVLAAFPQLAGTEASVASLDGEPRAPLGGRLRVAPGDFVTLLCTPTLMEVASR